MGNSVFVGWDYINEYPKTLLGTYWQYTVDAALQYVHIDIEHPLALCIYIYIYMTCMFRCKRFVDLDHLRHISGFTLQKLPRPAEHPQFLRMIWKAYSHMSIAQTHQPQVKTKNFAVPRNTCWILLGE